MVNRNTNRIICINRIYNRIIIYNKIGNKIMKNIHYDDFTNCIDLNDWALKHLEYNIINIETLSKCPFSCRVWYWYNTRGNL